MKAIVYVSGGIALTRDVYAEIRRRMSERGASPEAIETFQAAADEFTTELAAYVKTLPE